ncbi:8720_t:CDS:10 [Ambispora gerdemannii]|uniref:8720_t:CDS:1 n=1 Tax=Ambispora gerdemannii TaxID=144530 RepID=A0A9N9AD31_9GLOM|nr:8720_t:CDS:10 [Ambispora gerdemannii]
MPPNRKDVANQNPQDRGREDELDDNNEPDNDDLTAGLAENASEVPNDDMEDDDLLLDDSLSPLEKIFLFAKSEAVFHRVYIAKELSMLIKDVEISDAVEFLLPLMNSLGTDPDDAVREAFAPELDKIIWFFYSHCPIKEPTPETTATIIPYEIKDSIPPRPHTPQRPSTPRDRSQNPQRPQTPKPESSVLPSRSQTPTTTTAATPNPPYLSPQSFTPLLHALLLDQNTGIATAAQNVVLSLVGKILEDTEVNAKDKEYLEKETLEGVVLGIGRLDQERAKREETGEWDNDNDDQSINGVAGSEEEAELGRMTMMSLISALASIVGPERSTRLFIPEIDKLAEEPVFYVRKEAAMAVGGLASIVPLDVITTKLLPIYDHFSTDPIWHVRRSCCLVLPTICSRLPPEMKSDRAIKGIDLFAGDVSRSVRSAAGEIIGELIATFQPGGEVPEKLVQHFLSLGPGRDTSLGSTAINSTLASYGLNQRDPERPYICSYNFPAVVLTLGPSRWDDLKETYASLTRDQQNKVRRSLACSLHEIAKVVGSEKTERDLLSVFAYYLADQDEVKSGLLEHLAAFIECLPEKTRNDYLPSLNEVWDGVKNHWRLRDVIAKQIPALCRLFDSQSVMNHILPLTIRAVKDVIASVRETAVSCFPTLFDVVRNDNTCYNELINQVKQFATDAGFRGRVVYVQIVNALISKNTISKIEFETHFLPALVSLASDRVSNVRIVLARLVSDICRSERGYANPSTRPIEANELIKLLAQDSDVDVRAFVYSLLPPEERASLLLSSSSASSAKNSIEKTENGLLHNNKEKDDTSINSPNIHQMTDDMAIDEPNDQENGLLDDDDSSNAMMGEIPIAFIGITGDAMEIDDKVTMNESSMPSSTLSSSSNPVFDSLKAMQEKGEQAHSQDNDTINEPEISAMNISLDDDGGGDGQNATEHDINHGQLSSDVANINTISSTLPSLASSMTTIDSDLMTTTTALHSDSLFTIPSLEEEERIIKKFANPSLEEEETSVVTGSPSNHVDSVVMLSEAENT